MPRQCLMQAVKALILLDFLEINQKFTPYLYLWKTGLVIKTYRNYKGVPEAPVKKESVSVEPNQEQNKEPAKGEKGELKKSVLQSLKEFQARAKAQEQENKEVEKSKAHKKGDVEL